MRDENKDKSKRDRHQKKKNPGKRKRLKFQEDNSMGILKGSRSNSEVIFKMFGHLTKFWKF